MSKSTRRPARIATVFAVFALAVSGAPADTVDLQAIRDNSIFSESGSESNGSGQRLFSGRTNFTGGGSLRRADIDTR